MRQYIQERQSNWELLRIISMLLIVAGHFVAQTNSCSVTTGFNCFFAYLIGSNTGFAVNLFLLIGTYFMVNSTFIFKRVLKLWGQIFFFTASINLLLLLLGKPYSMTDCIRSFFPFFLSPLWFGSVYIALLLISPFLKRFLKNLTQQQHLGFWILLLLMNLLPSIPTKHHGAGWYEALSWFIFVYVGMAYYKKFCKTTHPAIYLVFGIGGILLLSGMNYMLAIYGLLTPKRIVAIYLHGYNTIPNFAISCCIFIFFHHLQLGIIKWINWLAGSAFAVYIFHQTPNFFMLLWNDIYDAQHYIQTDFFIPYSIGVCLATYTIATVIDKLRGYYIEPLFLNSRIVQSLTKVSWSVYGTIESNEKK